MSPGTKRAVLVGVIVGLACSILGLGTLKGMLIAAAAVLILIVNDEYGRRR